MDCPWKLKQMIGQGSTVAVACPSKSNDWTLVDTGVGGGDQPNQGPDY